LGEEGEILKRIKIGFGLVLLLLLMAGCVAQLPVQPQAVLPTVATEEDSSDAQAACPTPSADQALVHNEAAGYCFLIPAGYEAEHSEETGTTVVRATAPTGGHRERLIIWMQEALGRSLAQVTEQVLLDYATPGMELEVSSVVILDGVQATVIGRMPGQDINRRVLVIQNGRIYEMMFIPDDPGMAQEYEEMETLFAAVKGSFTFTPPTAPLAVPFYNAQESGYPTNALLWWERHVVGDGYVIVDCHRLAIAADGATWAGNCEQAAVKVANPPYQWTEILNRFAPFVLRGGDSVMVFAGQGQLYHPVWQQALGNWAQVSHGETVSGRVSATSRTALSWWLNEAEGEAGLCKHLVVLSHGYAYANVDPCKGGDSQTVAEGWLETAEMEAFGRWLFNAAPTALEDNYLDGRGEQELSQEELAQLAQWAEDVYQRLRAENGQ
jgi:hypothetical protein